MQNKTLFILDYFSGVYLPKVMKKSTKFCNYVNFPSQWMRNLNVENVQRPKQISQGKMARECNKMPLIEVEIPMVTCNVGDYGKRKIVVITKL